MKPASSRISESDRAAVAAAIAEAESATSAEFVVAVASRSGRYDRAEDTFGLAVALLAVAIASAVGARYGSDAAPSGSWQTALHIPFDLPATLLLFAAAAVAGSYLATAVPALAMPLASRRHRLEEVHRAGDAAFHRLRVHRTPAHTGILIYVSLLERTALVVGDEAITAGMPPTVWDAACGDIVEAFGRRDHATGLVRAIQRFGAIAAERFPAAPGQTSRLPNALHVLD